MCLNMTNIRVSLVLLRCSNDWNKKEWSLCYETSLKIAGKTLVNNNDPRSQGWRKDRKKRQFKETKKMCGNEGIWGFY